MFKNRVAAIHIDAQQWDLVVASPNLETNQIELEYVGIYSDLGKLKVDLAKFSISHISYSISTQYCKSFTTQALALNESNVEAEVLARGITNHENYDYFSFANSSILVSLPTSNLSDISQFQPALELKCSYSITQANIVLAYSVLRNYSDRQQNSIAILNFEQNHIALTILQNSIVKQTLWLAIKQGEDLVTQLVTLLTSGSRFCEQQSFTTTDSSVSIGTYDLLIGAGEITLEFLINLRSDAASKKIKIHEVELLDCLRGRLVSTQKLPTNLQLEIEQSSHCYALPIAAIKMHVENLGVDLTKKIVLAKRFTSDFEIKINQNIINKGVAVALNSAKKIVPSVASQKYLVLAVLVLSLALTGYKYVNYNSKLVDLETAYLAEKTKENGLIGVKIDYELAQKRNKLKNDRITAIKNIQKTQLLIGSIFSDLQSLSYQSQFKGLVDISSVEITGSNIRVTGQAIDKTGAVAFVNKIQQNPNYEDVIPTYKSLDNVRCAYDLSTRFIGAVPVNEVSLPRVNQLQVATSQKNIN